MANKTTTPTRAGTVTRSQPEPTTSAMTKQIGNLPPADGAATRTMQGTARGSNEQQTGVTEYEVQPGFTVRARGRDYIEGTRVPLNPTDAARLIEQGRVKAAKGAKADSRKADDDSNTDPMAKHLDANAPEVIATVKDGDFSDDDLAHLADLEKAGKDRSTVLEAIEAKRQALADDGGAE